MRRDLLLLFLSSFLLIAIISTQPAVASPPTAQYTKTWGGSGNDYGQGVAIDTSGNIYVTGSTYSFGPGNPSHSAVLLLKYNSSGVLLWQRIWSGSGNASDAGFGVAVDGVGNIYVAGRTLSFGAGISDLLLLKFNSTGSLLWQKTLGGSDIDDGFGVAVDASGNVYVTGDTSSFGAGGSDVLILKFNSTGSLLWQKTWGGSGAEQGIHVAVDSSGNVYVTGSTSSFHAGGDVLLLKFNSTGGLLWQKVMGGGSSSAAGLGVSVDISGNVYVTGDTANYGAGSFDVLLSKFNSTGGLLWQKTWGGRDYDAGAGVAVDGAGNIYVTGITYSFGAGGADVFLLKLSSMGSLLSQKIYGGSNDDFSYGVAVDSAGNAFITGYVSEAPPYTSTATGNNTLGTPMFSLSTPSFTLGTPTFQTRNPPGIVTTPVGSQTYAGGQDLLLVKFNPSITGVPLPANLVTLSGLLLTIKIMQGRRRNPRD